MVAEIIDGKSIAASLKAELKTRVSQLKEKGIVPHLTAILVGEDPASLSYIRGITRGCSETGVSTSTIKLETNISQSELMYTIKRLNQDPSIHGIILQLPLPPGLNVLEAESAISPDKDVDGTNPVNIGKLLLGEDTYFPSTPYGVQEILMRSGHNPEGRHVVICGRSNIVGKPLMGMLIQKQAGANATVTVCHTGTRNLPSITRQADILVAAIGKANAVTSDMVKEGAVVIDVGVNQVQDPVTGKPRLVGDVDFEDVKKKAGAITPVPGGTGPMTTVMLISNTIKAAEKQSK